MNKSKKLTALFTGTTAVLLLSGTSAFADYRHRAETRNDSQAAQTEQHRNDSTEQYRGSNRTQNEQGRRWDRSQGPTQTQPTQRYDRSQAQSTQRYDRSQAQSTQRYDRSQTQSTQRFDRAQAYNRSLQYNQPRVESQRFDNRGSSRSQSYNRAPIRNESRYYSGRVNRVERYNSGFRVWIGGAPYPFFIGGDRWARFPLRVGLGVRLGGYWDPLGYYNAYDVGPYAYSTAGDIHGVVESVDYRRGTAVLRSFVTVVLRGNDPRLGSLRPGDYVDLSGAWNRAGVFDAFNVAEIRGGAPYGYDGGPYDGRNDDRY